MQRHSHSLRLSVSVCATRTMVAKKVAVIGAGTAGICAAKTALQNGFDVTVFEQSDVVGGTWVYRDHVGKDKYGLEYGYMYKDLMTNAPKEIMGFPDLTIPAKDKWFLTSDEILDFLQYYARTFNVQQVIKFRHHVIRVSPMRNKQWEIIVKDVVNDEYVTEFFDFVMVCNGHHSDPRMPSFPGAEKFRGEQVHSHCFRKKEQFTGK